MAPAHRREHRGPLAAGGHDHSRGLATAVGTEGSTKNGRRKHRAAADLAISSSRVLGLADSRCKRRFLREPYRRPSSKEAAHARPAKSWTVASTGREPIRRTIRYDQASARRGAVSERAGSRREPGTGEPEARGRPSGSPAALAAARLRCSGCRAPRHRPASIRHPRHRRSRPTKTPSAPGARAPSSLAPVWQRRPRRRRGARTMRIMRRTASPTAAGAHARWTETLRRGESHPRGRRAGRTPKRYGAARVSARTIRMSNSSERPPLG